MHIHQRKPARELRTLTIGITLISLAAVLTPSAVEFWLVPDHDLAPGNTRLMIQLIRGCLLGLGIYWLWRRPHWQQPLLASVLCSVAGIIVVASAYGTYQRLQPPAWKASGLIMTERLERIAENTLMHTGQLGIAYYRKLLRLPLLRDSKTLRLKHAIALLEEGETNAAIHQFEWIKTRLTSDGDAHMSETVRRYLAIAHLRRGEQENCIARHAQETCIVPIRLSGQHLLPQGSKRAIEILQEILADTPDDAGARWLLNIAYMTIGG